MSSSIAIPQRRNKRPLRHADSPSSSLGDAASSLDSSTASPVRYEGKGKGKEVVRDNESVDQTPQLPRDRRPSLLSSSLSRTEHVVVDIGDEEGARLITCVKASQGFDWNQEIFFPSYMGDFDIAEFEHRQEPVTDIVLTEEERNNMLPS